MGCCASRAGRDLPPYTTELNKATPVDVRRYPLYEDQESTLTQDIAQTVVPLEKAFRDDPVVRYFLPNATGTLNAALHFWLERVVTQVTDHNLCFETESHKAVAAWVPNGVHLVDSIGPEAEVHLGGKFDEFKATLEKLDAQRAEHTTGRQCMHLAVLGCRPDEQGKGHAAVILAPVLRLCDKDEILAFVHVTNNHAIDFCRKLGFQVCDELILDEDANARITSMKREPRPRQTVHTEGKSDLNNPMSI